MAGVTFLYYADLSRILTYLADDAFFSFQMARMTVKTGIISMDGETATNGFHPLWMYIMIGLAALKEGFFHYLVAQVTVHVLGIFFFYRALRRYSDQINPLVFLAVALFFAPLLITSFNGLETSALVCMVGACFWYFFQSHFNESKHFFIKVCCSVCCSWPAPIRSF